MSNLPGEFYPGVQRARKLIFKRYLLSILFCFAGIGVVWWLVEPFSESFDGFVMAIWFICAIVLLSSPIRKLQKMPCPYCHYPARTSMLPFRHFRCQHCQRSIGEGMLENQRD
jgi:hypothetical protein